MRPQPGPGFTAPVAASGSPNYGPELWPQPAFAASTGLTLSHATISGGKLNFAGAGTPPQRARATLGAGTLVAGATYHWVLTIDAKGTQEPLSIIVGSVTQNISPASGPGVFSGDIVSTAISQNIDISDVSGGDLTGQFSTFSVKQVL